MKELYERRYRVIRMLLGAAILIDGSVLVDKDLILEALRIFAECDWDAGHDVGVEAGSGRGYAREGFSDENPHVTR